MKLATIGWLASLLSGAPGPSDPEPWPTGSLSRAPFARRQDGRTVPGSFEAANSGTLFPDELGEIPPAMQVKLLRALQEREVRRVGENTSRPVNVRIVPRRTRI